MHPADIKAGLAKAGSSQSVIARGLVGRTGQTLTPGAVWLVIHGLARSERIARAISEVLQVPVRDIFPGRYPALEKMQAIEARGGFAAVLRGPVAQRNPQGRMADTHQGGGAKPLAKRAAVKQRAARPRPAKA